MPIVVTSTPAVDTESLILDGLELRATGRIKRVKRCAKCGVEKPAAEFYRQRKSPDGLQYSCKVCQRAHSVAWRNANPERYAEYHASWKEANRERSRVVNAAWREANHERAIAATRAWEEKHREREAAKARAWYEANKERRLLTMKEWVEANPERMRAKRDRRRARHADAFVEEVRSLVVLERDDGLCGICGKDVDPLRFHVDHIIPLARGGEHSYANVQVAHPLCNSRKHAMLPWELVA